MAGPPEQTPAAGRGHLRASCADREQVIGILKAAFVQGRLAKDEFDLRIGQAMTSRTHAQLDILTADLPAGPAAAKPPQPGQAQGEPRIRRPGLVLTLATVICASVWPVVFLLPKNGEGEPQGGLALVALTALFYLILLLMTGTPIIADWLNKRW